MPEVEESKSAQVRAEPASHRSCRCSSFSLLSPQSSYRLCGWLLRSRGVENIRSSTWSHQHQVQCMQQRVQVEKIPQTGAHRRTGSHAAGKPWVCVSGEMERMRAECESAARERLLADRDPFQLASSSQRQDASKSSTSAQYIAPDASDGSARLCRRRSSC